MSKKHESETCKGELLIYRDKDGDMKLEVQLQNETDELQFEATVAKFTTVQNDQLTPLIKVWR